MHNVILTGFEPFGPYEFNPTQDIVRHFDGREIASHTVIGKILRCTYKESSEILKKLINETQPTAILSTGLSSSVKGVRIETVGKNIMNGKYPDADGWDPSGVPLVEGADELVFAQSDGERLHALLKEKRILTQLSTDADGFICNALLFQTANFIQQSRSKMRSAFIHIPWTDRYENSIQLEAGKCMMPEETLFNAVELLIEDLVAQANAQAS